MSAYIAWRLHGGPQPQIFVERIEQRGGIGYSASVVALWLVDVADGCG